jgi:hypothetical protein
MSHNEVTGFLDYEFTGHFKRFSPSDSRASETSFDDVENIRFVIYGENPPGFRYFTLRLGHSLPQRRV